MALTPVQTWHERYTAAILEIDTAKIPSRISEARDVIAQHLEDGNNVHPERDRMLQALRMLELLQRVECQRAA